MVPTGWAAIFVAVDIVLRIGLAVRVIMRRRPVGVSLAWLTLILSFPYVGVITYLLVGELRLGRERARRAARLHPPYRRWLRGLSGRYGPPNLDGLEGPELARLIQAGGDIPPLPGNELTLIGDAETFFRRLIADIDAARRSCHLEFYIWADGGLADEVVDALLRARGRGVVVRVLVDDLGSRAFLRGPQARRLREGGVALRSALKVNLLRMAFVRFDLRLHRKIAVIDGELAYTGSQNLVDPRFFKQGAGVGEWVDAMVRLRGPAVEALGVTFLEDWELETGESPEELAGSHDVHTLAEVGPSAVQVVPSGPGRHPDGMRAVVMMAIYAASRELVLTTPYFVPEEAMLIALISAARRGVEVTLVVPAKIDSKLVNLASRAFQGDLARAGVRVMLFDAGLLHTKSISVDGELALFGSLNLDPRSFTLNFEITLAVYGPSFAGALRRLQEDYIARSRPLDLMAWEARPFASRFAEDAARLAGPLL